MLKFYYLTIPQLMLVQKSNLNCYMDPMLAIMYSSLPPLNRSNQPCGAPSDVIYFCWNLDWFNSNPNLNVFP